MHAAQTGTQVWGGGGVKRGRSSGGAEWNEGEDGDRNGSGKGDNQALGEKERKRKESDELIWERSEIAGKKGRALPVGFSALYPLCVQSNLYTITLVCNWKTDGSAKWWRQKKKCKEFWEQRGREEHSQGHPVMDICRETFPVCLVVCSSICAAALCFITQLPALIDKQKHEAAIEGNCAIWERSELLCHLPWT